MLREETKSEIRAHLKALESVIPGFQSRPAQRMMIAEIAKTLARMPDPAPEGASDDKRPPRPPSEDTVVVVQAGTGCGKSVGYIVGALPLALAKKKKLVISTGTIALQEQLVVKDLPAMLRVSKKPDAVVAIAKGRTRYACTYRLIQAQNDLAQLAMFGREERAGSESNEETRELIDGMIKDLAEKRWNGDRDERPGLPDTLWRAITTDRFGCLNRNCPVFHGCPQVEARKRLKAADVIVANHDLVLADLSLGGGKILPAPDQVCYVFDEAHHLPDKAVSAFSSSHLVKSSQRMAEKVRDLATSLAQGLGGGYAARARELQESAETLAGEMANAYRFFESLSQLRPTEKIPRPQLDFKVSMVPEGFHEMGEQVVASATSVVKMLSEAVSEINEIIGDDSSRKALLEKLSADAGFYAGRAGEVLDTWSLFLEEPAVDDAPIAKWITGFRMKGSQQVEFELNASPVIASGYLRHMLWEKAAGVVLTSATMTNMGDFDDFLRRTGLSGYPGRVNCLDLPSPFDYAAQGTIDIVKMKSSPKKAEEHTREVCERIVPLLSAATEGVLVLFTARSSMKAAVEALSPKMREMVHVQGDGSKQTIIAAHKARIDQGLPSAIFGLDSFSEGIDLSGSYCSHVIVTKIPFSVPDDPVTATLSDWVERRGGQPFNEIFVPQAARKLMQAVGRLIRTERDYGTVTIMDPRLWTTGYGRRMLKGLPPFRLVAMGKEQSL